MRTIREPGLYFKYPFVQDLIVLDKRILAAEARPAEYITLDKKRLTVDTVSRWKIQEPAGVLSNGQEPDWRYRSIEQYNNDRASPGSGKTRFQELYT